MYKMRHSTGQTASRSWFPQSLLLRERQIPLSPMCALIFLFSNPDRERGGPGRVPRDRDDDEGRTVNDMKTILRHQGSGGTEVRCRNERAVGRQEYGGDRTGEGAGMNRNKSEIGKGPWVCYAPNSARSFKNDASGPGRHME
jgi:hypothetical protein